MQSTFETDEHLRTLKAVAASSLKGAQPGSEFASFLVVADAANLIADLRVEGSFLQRLV
jgi:hypothetical protein